MSMQNVSLSRPFRFSIAAIASFFIGCQLWSLFLAESIYSVSKFGRAGDFHGFFDTVEAALGDGSIDLGGAFFKPPFFAVVISGLIPLGFKTAATVYQALLTIVVVVVVTTLCWLKARDFWVTFALLLVVLCSYPFHFLLDRGNVDAFSLASVFFAVVAQQMRLPVVAALLFAVGVHLKSNVIVLLPVLIMHRSLFQMGWSSLLVALCTVLIAALTPAWTLQWLHVASTRANWETGIGENGSIFRAFVSVPHGEWVAWFVLGVSSVFIIAGCLRRVLSAVPPTRIDLFLLCLPLCQAYPKQAYLYGYVFLPLLLVLYSAISSRPLALWSERFFGVLGCCGVVLSCFPSGFLINGGIEAEWASLFPSAGLVLMLVANSVLIWTAKLSPAEEGEERRLDHTFTATWAFRILSGSCWMIILVLCIASGYSLLMYAKATDSGVLWFPPSIASVEGTALRGTPFRVRHPKQEWGRLRFNRAVFGRFPLKIGGVEYDIGLGTHGRSSFELVLPPGAHILSGRCGLDDAAGMAAAGFVCVILAGQNELFRSRVMKTPGTSDIFRVSVAGESFVTLQIENVTPVNHWNHADWVELRVE